MEVPQLFHIDESFVWDVLAARQDCAGLGLLDDPRHPQELHALCLERRPDGVRPRVAVTIFARLDGSGEARALCHRQLRDGCRHFIGRSRPQRVLQHKGDEELTHGTLI